jgi:hypothetical protein
LQESEKYGTRLYGRKETKNKQTNKQVKRCVLLLLVLGVTTTCWCCCWCVGIDILSRETLSPVKLTTWLFVSGQTQDVPKQEDDKQRLTNNDDSVSCHDGASNEQGE